MFCWEPLRPGIHVTTTVCNNWYHFTRATYPNTNVDQVHSPHSRDTPRWQWHITKPAREQLEELPPKPANWPGRQSQSIWASAGLTGTRPFLEAPSQNIQDSNDTPLQEIPLFLPVLFWSYVIMWQVPFSNSSRCLWFLALWFSAVPAVFHLCSIILTFSCVYSACFPCSLCQFICSVSRSAVLFCHRVPVSLFPLLHCVFLAFRSWVVALFLICTLPFGLYLFLLVYLDFLSFAISFFYFRILFIWIFSFLLSKLTFLSDRCLPVCLGLLFD